MNEQSHLLSSQGINGVGWEGEPSPACLGDGGGGWVSLCLQSPGCGEKGGRTARQMYHLLPGHSAGSGAISPSTQQSPCWCLAPDGGLPGVREQAYLW